MGLKDNVDNSESGEAYEESHLMMSGEEFQKDMFSLK